MKRAVRSVLVAGAALAALTGVLYPSAARSASTDPNAVTAPRPAQVHTVAVPRQPFPGDADRALQVVSVVATTRTSTTATLTAWQRSAVGRAWHRVGRPQTVRVGARGLTARETEGSGKTPIGSFALSRAFGRDPNAGRARTRLAYRQLQVGDGWSSQQGPSYNTFERNTGELYLGRDGWARDAVLIDYNVGRVRQGAGSGFFLHVGASGNRPTVAWAPRWRRSAACCTGSTRASTRGS